MRELRRATVRLGGQRARRAGGRPVRGAVHRLPRRARARRVRRRAASAPPGPERAPSSCSRVRADFYGRCAAYPELSRAARRRTTCSSARCRATSCAGRSTRPAAARRAARRARARRRLRRRRRGRARRAAAALDRAARAVAAARRAAACGWPAYEPQRRRPRRGGAAGRGRATSASTPAQQAVARRVLLRLAGEDDDGAPSCAGASRSPSSTRDATTTSRRVLDVLADGRLLTVSDGTVEVAHEALLREWPRLRGWLEEDAEGRRLHRHLIQRGARLEPRAAAIAGELYRGARLASALEWRAEHEPELNAAEQRVPRREPGRRRARPRVALRLVARRRGGAPGGRRRARPSSRSTSAVGARAEARAAEAQRLGAQALSEPTLDRSLLLARQGVALDDTPATRDNLLAALRRSPAAIGVMRGDGDALTAIALHPDGRTLAVGDDDGTVVVPRRRHAAAARPAASDASPCARISSLAFSPDGTRLASAGMGRARGGFVDLFDGRSAPPHRARSTVDPLRAPSERALLARLPRARGAGPRAATSTSPTGCCAGTPDTGRRLGRRRPTSRGRSPALLGFLGSSAQLVTSSAEDARDRHPRRRHAARRARASRVAGPVAALSPAGGLVAFGIAGRLRAPARPPHRRAAHRCAGGTRRRSPRCASAPAATGS